jgi:hypothetical protein
VWGYGFFGDSHTVDVRPLAATKIEPDLKIRADHDRAVSTTA